jgi:hypothetical protein
LQRLVEILELTHELLSKHVKIDPFNILMGEMTQSISLVSFSGRIATQVHIRSCMPPSKSFYDYLVHNLWGQLHKIFEMHLKTCTRPLSFIFIFIFILFFPICPKRACLLATH